MGTSTLALPSAVRSALSRGRAVLRSRGINAVVTSTFRTRSEQRFLFDQFQRGLTSFPVAPPGTSRHEFGLAVDMVAIPPSGLSTLVDVMRSVGFRWAGPSDSVHFDFVLPVTSSRMVPERARMLKVATLMPPRSLPIPKAGASRPPVLVCLS